MLYDAQNRSRCLYIGAVLLGIALYHSAGPRLQHGLTATHFYDSDFNSIAATRIERVAMVSSNDALIARNRPFSIRWEGYLWVNKNRKGVITIPNTVGVRLLLDDKLAQRLLGDDSSQHFTFAYNLSPGSHALTVEFNSSAPGDNFFSTGLEWNTFLGPRLIPSTFLYPSAPEDGQARRELYRSQVRNIGFWIAALSTLVFVGVKLAHKRHALDNAELWGLIIIIAAALCFRLIYLRDLVTQIPDFNAFPIGSDHRSYEAAARDFVRGLWPPARDFYRQPGFTWLLGNFHAILGPTLRPFQFLQMVSGAISSAVIYAIGKRIFGPATGWVAALLWAIFPLAIFYDAQFVTHGLEAQMVVWSMWLWLSAIERPNSTALITLGLISGCAAVIRPALLAFVPLAATSIVWTSRPSWKRGTAHGLVLVGLAALPVLPVTLHNYRHTGRIQLISANGPVTLYLGNNRNAAGIGQYSQAFRATHERVNRGEVTYIGATLSDVRSSPRRWVGLMARKTALYFGNLEIPNNVDFVTEGTEVSLLLAKTPLRYGTIVALGLMGFTLAISRPHPYKRGIWMLAAVMMVLCLTTVVFHVVSRFRVPTYGPLILLSAFALVEGGRSFSDRRIRTCALPLVLLAASSAVVMALPWVADNSMPLPTLPAPPADSVPARAVIHETLELSGHKPFPAVEPGEPLFVTLYWKPNSSFSTDYYGTVQLITPSNEKLTQVDQRLGSGSFPNYPTSRWNPGETVRDQYLLFLPRDTHTPLALSVLVAVYNRKTGERIGETILGTLPLTFSQPLDLSRDVTPVNATIGPALLAAYEAKFENNELALTLFWTAIDPPSVDGVVFVHIFDSSGDFVLGQDLPPRAGTYPMTAWQPGEGIVDARIIPLGTLPASEYAVFVGAYDPATGERLPTVDNAGHNLPHASLKLFQTHFDSE